MKAETTRNPKQAGQPSVGKLNLSKSGEKISLSPNTLGGNGMPMGGMTASARGPVAPVKGPGGPTRNENLRGYNNGSGR